MGYVRTSVAGIRGLLEALGSFKTPEGIEGMECVKLFEMCRSSYPNFEVVLRLQRFGVFDRLQQLPPRLMEATLTWIVKDQVGGVRYDLSEGEPDWCGETIDVPFTIYNVTTLRRLLEAAAHSLERFDQLLRYKHGEEPIPLCL